MIARALLAVTLALPMPLVAQAAPPPGAGVPVEAAPAAGDAVDAAPSARVAVDAAPAAAGALDAAPAAAGAADAAAAPVAVVTFVSTIDDLRAALPADTTSFWHKRPGPDAARLVHHGRELARAVLDARFDAWLIDVLEQAGVAPWLVDEIAGWRNLLATFGGLVPWGALLEGEVLLAQSRRPAFGGGPGWPSALLAARPPAAAREEIGRTLPALVASLGALFPVHVRYDVEAFACADGSRGVRHALRVPAFGEATVLELRLVGDVVILAFGAAYGGAAADLAGGALAPRLVDAPRFEAAFEALDGDGPVHHYIDVRALVEHAQDVRDVLAPRAFASGPLQGWVAEAFSLLDHVETVASVARLEGDRLVLETATRFDPDVPSTDPMLSFAFAAPASPALLELVPADAVAFEMRGAVDLVPLYRRALARLDVEGTTAARLLWIGRVLGAAADLSIERDVLTWLGNEHVVVTVPARGRGAGPGATETVVLLPLADAAGARKCLARLQAVGAVAFPPLIERMTETLARVGAPVPRLTLTPGEGPYASLDRLSLAIDGLPFALPFALPSVTYGVLGRTAVIATSQDALAYCLEAAAMAVPGLDEHPLAAEVFARDGVTSARLLPVGQQLAQTADGLRSLGQMATVTLTAALGSTRAAWVPESVGDLFHRASGVLDTVDFVGDALTWSERRARGRVAYERTTLELTPWDGAAGAALTLARDD